MSENINESTEFGEESVTSPLANEKQNKSCKRKSLDPNTPVFKKQNKSCKRKSLDPNTPVINLTSLSEEDIDHKVKCNLEEKSFVNLLSCSQHGGDQKRSDLKEKIDNILSRAEKTESDVQDLKKLLTGVQDLTKVVNELKEFIMNNSGQNGASRDNGRKFFSPSTFNKKEGFRPNLETISVDDGYLIKRLPKKDDDDFGKDEITIPMWLSVMFKTKQALNLTQEECVVASYVFGSSTDTIFNEKELLVKPQIDHCVGQRKLFQCLKPMKMLEMDLINLAVSMLTFNEKKDGSNAKYWFLPTVFSQYVQSRQFGTADLKAYYKDIFMNKVDQVSKIFIPMHDSDSMHWFLLVVDLANKKLIYLDSLPSSSAYARRKMSIKHLALFMEELLTDSSFYDKKTSPKPNVSEFQITTPKDLGKQADNSNDCGVWVITWMKELRKNVHKIKVDVGTRLKIALDLIMDSHNQLNQEILERARGMEWNKA